MPEPAPHGEQRHACGASLGPSNACRIGLQPGRRTRIGWARPLPALLGGNPPSEKRETLGRTDRALPVGMHFVAVQAETRVV